MKCDFIGSKIEQNKANSSFTGKGVGLFAVDISKYDMILSSILYTGENPPHMWWSKFEHHITYAFNAYDKNEVWKVLSYSMCLRILLGEINYEFLSVIKKVQTLSS